MIFTTAYTSEMVRPMSDVELIDLLVGSRTRCAARGVTGLLLYRSGRVMQMLEGDADVVRDLYDRIRMDVRHTNVTNVWTSSASRRRFPTWTMGFENLEQDDTVSAHGLADRDEPDAFSPLLLEGSITPAQEDYLERRRAALRRALVSGDRLVGALGIILNGHEPELIEAADGPSIGGCRECRGQDAPVLDDYPCPTAKNALWALEASSR